MTRALTCTVTLPRDNAPALLARCRVTPYRRATRLDPEEGEIVIDRLEAGGHEIGTGLLTAWERRAIEELVGEEAGR